MAPFGHLFFNHIGPAEIVQAGNEIRVPAGRNDPAHRQVHGRGRHPVGIDIRVKGVYPLGKDNAFTAAVFRQHDAGIGRHIEAAAPEGLYDAAALDLMVILPGLLFIRAHVKTTEHLQKGFPMIRDTDLGLLKPLSYVACFKLIGRIAMMKKIQVEIGHGFFFVAHVKFTALCKYSER